MADGPSDRLPSLLVCALLVVSLILAARVAGRAGSSSGLRIEAITTATAYGDTATDRWRSATSGPPVVVAAATAVSAPAPSAISAATPSAAQATDLRRVTPMPSPTPGTAIDGADSALEAVVRRALGPDVDSASVVAVRLADGDSARVNADHVYYAASLYKLEVLYAAYQQRRTGALDFDRRVSLSDRYLEEDLGTAGRLPLDPAGDIAVRDAVAAMITYSDNTSATLLLDLLGHREIDATMTDLGLRASSVNTVDLPTTANDMASLMTAIVSGRGMDSESTREMMDLLLHQETRAGIPRGVPVGVPVGNKWGSWDGNVHDVAFVLAPRGAYVLAVLTSTGWDTIARVSRAVYDYWNGTP